MTLPCASKHAPLFRLAELILLLTNAALSLSHPSAVLFEQAPRGLETPRGGRLGGWGSLLPPLSPAAKSWGWCPLSPSDSLAGALQAESGAPRATRPPESRREIAPTLGTS